MHASEIGVGENVGASLNRRTLAVGTTITLRNLRRPLVARELAWLHAALTARLGRDHGEARRDWSIMPWQCESGCAVVWWNESDGLALARTVAPSRIGRIDTAIELGNAVRIHAPPRYAPGDYRVRLTTRSIVIVSSSMTRGPLAGKRVYRTRADAQTIESALRTLARRLDMTAAPEVEIIEDRTVPSSIYMRGKPRRMHGWEGAVDLVANAPARWLLECSSRGLGLGARGAYGCGAVHVESLG